jgi:hypothetical protein
LKQNRQRILTVENRYDDGNWIGITHAPHSNIEAAITQLRLGVAGELEPQLQRELQNPRIARRSELAEILVVEAGLHRVDVRMVDGVERLPASLQLERGLQPSVARSPRPDKPLS